MLKLLLIFITSLSLFSQDAITAKNPNVYKSLGDSIYNNLPKIESLKKLKKYEAFQNKIDDYSGEVNKAKVFGFEVETGDRSNVKLDYLKKIRELSKVNDYFLRTVQSSFKSAIEMQDSELFIGIVNSGMIDTQMNKNKIMNYYNQHKDEIIPDGVIQDFIDEEYAKKHVKKYKPKTKKQLQEEKIRRLKTNDMLKQEALEKKLAKEVEEKKKVIRQNQEKELFN